LHLISSDESISQPTACSKESFVFLENIAPYDLGVYYYKTKN